MQNINISYIGMSSSEALEKYLKEKLLKYEVELIPATNIDVFFKQNVHARGVDADFRIDINIQLPKAVVRVEESGADMYALIDKATDIVIKRVRRYSDKKKNWDGNIPWRVLEAQEAINIDVPEDNITDNYANYIPKISVRKKLEDMSPMQEGEAIEKMELMGFNQMLFKNIKTGKISMLYKRNNGDYGLVEPGDTF